MNNGRIILTTLCYIKHENKYLMLLRNKKENDLNEGKWIGVGGKFLDGETPEECLKREVYEETGLTLSKYLFNGVIRFISDSWDNEDMYLYTGLEFSGELIECNEGTLKWIDEERVMSLNLWEGDRLFMNELIAGKSSLFMRLCYEGDTLVESKVYDSLEDMNND